jgi:hypothetical protein
MLLRFAYLTVVSLSTPSETDQLAALPRSGQYSVAVDRVRPSRHAGSFHNSGSRSSKPFAALSQPLTKYLTAVAALAFLEVGGALR